MTPAELRELNELRQLKRTLKDWVVRFKVSCEEDIYQSDRVQEALPELAEIVAG